MKYLKIFSLVVLSVCMIVLAGCGEEENIILLKMKY